VIGFEHDDLPAPHRTLVRVVIADDDSGYYALYDCQDPTCEWCVTELTGNVREFTNFPLDKRSLHAKIQEGRGDSRDLKLECQGQRLLFEGEA